ncbi:amidohydrolase [Shewanella sp. OPT22]|nr:amidohydrolase [Shewanella sp. OPT22]
MSKILQSRILQCLLLFIVATSTVNAKGLNAQVEEQMSHLKKTYLYLHQHPELSYHEKNTGQYIAKRLTNMGFDVTSPIGGYGVVGLFKNGDGPTVMYRTDTDALPVVEQTGVPYASKITTLDKSGNKVGVMHACGHDIHMTTFLGTAHYLVNNKDKWSGTLMMVAQPAEEVGGGAKALLNQGLFKRIALPDHIVAFHTHANLPAGKVGIAPGYIMANVDSVDIEVKGISGHGAYPNKTVDPIVIASRIVLALQTITSREISPIDPSVVTVGAIQGGSKRSVIGNKVVLKLTVRSYKPKVRKHQIEAIKRISKGIALSAGLKGDLLPNIIVYKNETAPALYNDPKQTAEIKASLINVLGKHNVIKTEPSMVGEDFARYGRTPDKRPITMIWLGGVKPAVYQESLTSGKILPTLHSAKFAPDYPLAIKTGVNAMSKVLIDLFDKKS